MINKWKLKDHDGLCRFELEIDTSGLVGLENERGTQNVLGDSGKIREVYGMGAWLAEGWRNPVSGRLHLTLLCMQPQKDRERMEINFEEGQADLMLSPLSGWDGNTPDTHKSVTMLIILPRQNVTVEVDDSVSQPTPSPTPESVPRPSPQPTLQTTPQPNTELEETRQELAETKSRCAALLERNRKLQETLGLRIDREFLPYLDTLSEGLGGDLKMAMERVAKAEEEMKRLEGQIEQTKCLAETRELDVDASQRELGELRERLAVDGDTAALMADEPFYEGRSVEGLFRDAHAALDQIEMALRKLNL